MDDSVQWHIITGEYPPQPGGVSDYTRLVAQTLAASGDEVHVWSPRAGAVTEKDANVVVHSDLGNIGFADLRRMNRMLDRFPAPRHLLVQWVPHAYGYRSINLLFCLWLWFRCKRYGDQLQL